MSTVYATRGRKYHADPKCPLMINGEYLWDGDGEDWLHIAGSYRREDPSPQYAAMRGKLPCLHCVPAEHRAFPPLYRQDFGHKPVTGIAPEGRALTSVCARCRTRQVYCWLNEWGAPHRGVRTVSVRWPCTSAIVLGLAPREEATK
ncbi:hypothetical protein ACFCYB_00360 [Streptomyces sp. NPDC056309]|uniref:hypothetical protein n=1 Tax=Streptomyces sp. NPDC056309 TaxID=3345781 RepID=UPI0035DA0D28